MDVIVDNYFYRSDIIGKFKDLTGQKFGRLTALYRLHNYHKKGTYWLCVCDCGNIKEVNTYKLQDLHTKSCGCLKIDKTIQRNKDYAKHNKSNTRLYRIWHGMKNRCYNTGDKDYKNYGGRGIAVCSKWLDDFQSFNNWSINSGYADNLTIDRIDTNKGYSPDNCRWVDMKAQQRNKRNNKTHTINGETHCLSEWCELLGLNYYTVCTRINKLKWSIERALEVKTK